MRREERADCEACESLPANDGPLCELCAAWVAAARTHATRAAYELERLDPSLEETSSLALPALAWLDAREPARQLPSGEVSEVSEAAQAPAAAETRERSFFSSRGPTVTPRPECRVHGERLTEGGRCMTCVHDRAAARRARLEREKAERRAKREQARAGKTTNGKDETKLSGEAQGEKDEQTMNDESETTGDETGEAFEGEIIDADETTGEASGALVLASSAPATLAPLAAQAEKGRAAAASFASVSMSKNTRDQYQKEWRSFVAFCSGASIEPFSVDSVLAYLGHIATEGGRKVAGVRVAKAAIAKAFEIKGLGKLSDVGAIKQTVAGIARTVAFERPETQAKALDLDTLRAMIEALPGAYTVLGPLAPGVDAIDEYLLAAARNDREGVRRATSAIPERLLLKAPEHVKARLRFLRDRALFLVSFFLGARRSEVCGPRGLRAEDIRFTSKGAVITSKGRASKTDQKGEGTTKGLPFGQDEAFCPVRALRAWLAAAAIKRGPVFVAIGDKQSAASVRAQIAAGEAQALTDVRAVQLIKEAFERATGETAADVSGHSMRRGAATTAAERTGDLLAVKKVTGHRSTAMAARYVEEADVLRNHPLAGL